MSDSKRYKRYFIILENEDTGFENKEKKIPKGYAKIEVKNGKAVLNVYVQDLKYFEDGKYIYRNLLISTGGSTYIDTGSFIIDEKGRGELKKKINPQNIENSGMTVADCNVVAIVAEPVNGIEKAKDIQAPLVGYIDKERVNWKSILKNKKKEERDQKEEEDIELDKEDKEKYDKIMKAIEEGSKELYEEPKIEKENEEKEPKEELKTKEKLLKEEYEKEEKEDIKNEEKIKDEEKKDEEVECVDSLENQNEESSKDNESKDENLQREYKEIEYGDKSYQEYTKETYKSKYEGEFEKKDNLEYLQENEMKHEEKTEKKVDEGYNKKYQEVEGKWKDYSQNQGPFYRQPNTQYKKYSQMVYKYVKDMLKHSEEIEPFEKNLKGYKWWKMMYDNQSMYRGFLPFFGYILNIYYYNPYMCYMNNCNNMMHKYGHYIFGIAYDKNNGAKYYVYGIPGRYLYKEQPFRGMTGFVYWHPLEDKSPKKGDYGYWLLHIDGKTGNVVFPKKPSIPPMY